MKAWVWLLPEVLLAVHEAQLAEHGGAAGTRDKGLFDSALSRPQNLAAYGRSDGTPPDVADLAASYGYGISRNHPFIDGNKRTGYVAAELFLRLNGCLLTATDADSVLTMLQVATGDISEEDFAAWIRQHVVRR
jgi:death-on-curing protein